MSPDMIRQLPEGRALVIRGSLAPTVARLPRAWKTRLYRQARRRGLAVAVLTPAPAAVSSGVPTAPYPELGGAAAPVALRESHLHIVPDEPAAAETPPPLPAAAAPHGDYPWRRRR